jgi:hypothetical protein
MGAICLRCGTDAKGIPVSNLHARARSERETPRVQLQSFPFRDRMGHFILGNSVGTVKLYDSGTLSKIAIDSNSWE